MERKTAKEARRPNCAVKEAWWPKCAASRLGYEQAKYNVLIEMYGSKRKAGHGKHNILTPTTHIQRHHTFGRPANQDNFQGDGNGTHRNEIEYSN